MVVVLWLTDRGEQHQAWAREAAAPGFHVVFVRVASGTAPSLEAVEEWLSVLHYIVSERSIPVTGELIKNCPLLRMVIRLGSLVHDIDMQAANNQRVRVHVEPVRSCIFCAEHAMLLILGLQRQLQPSMDALHKESQMQRRRTTEDEFCFNWTGAGTLRSLLGSTVGILGMGEIGVELARRLKPFGCAQVLYNKRTPLPAAAEKELGIAYASAETCIAQADVLVSLLPHGAGAALGLPAGMKKGAVLVGLGSGGEAGQEETLLEALESGALGGLALDTFSWEPLDPLHPLAKAVSAPAGENGRPNILLTPHVAAVGPPALPNGPARHFRAGDWTEMEKDAKRRRGGMLVALCGLPGSGKSSFARHAAERAGAIVVSFDDDEKAWDDHSAFREGRTVSLGRLADAFFKDPGALVVADDNLYYRSMRKQVKRIAKKAGVQYVVVFFDVAVELCMARNWERSEGRVPEAVVERMAARFEPPEEGEQCEIIKYQGDKETLENILASRNKGEAQSLEAETERGKKQMPQHQSQYHELDLALRKETSRLVEAAAPEERAREAARLSKLRAQVLHDPNASVAKFLELAKQ